MHSKSSHIIKVYQDQYCQKCFHFISSNIIPLFQCGIVSIFRFGLELMKVPIGFSGNTFNEVIRKCLFEKVNRFELFCVHFGLSRVYTLVWG